MACKIRTAGFQWSVLLTAFFSFSGWSADRPNSVAEGLLDNPDSGLFVEALTKTELWQQIVETENVTVFVPSDTSLRNEGSAFLLEVVLLKAENTERLQDLIAQHVFPAQSDSSDMLPGPRTLTNDLGGCATIIPSGEKSVRVGPEAVVTGHKNYANGDVYTIDRLLWQSYDATVSC